MKKIIIIVIAIAALGGLGWYAMHLSDNKGKSDTELIDFSIQNVEEVDKFIISDAFGKTIEIVKGEELWTDAQGGCISQASVGFILEAFGKIEFKGYLPDDSHDHYNTMMAAQSTKVEIFANGEWTKTWYIGPSTQDHYGQIMLLDSKEYGMSSFPVKMKIRGLNGIIEPRFFADSRKWMCTNIFRLHRDQIAEINVEFTEVKERSFSVIKSGNRMSVYQQGVQLSNIDTANLFRYINNYEKVHFEKPNYELSAHQVDSLKATQPFCILTVKEITGKETKLRCFHMRQREQTETGYIEYITNDEDRFWCELPNGQVVKCQFFVFNPLLLGHIYFPMDLSALEEADE
ncbi:MAG: hypothetical protein QNK23_05775 [Crocinitomicaceae bacterium]|nr:hypothetical protein [Crocinitomicaceae bacterium]